MVGPRQVVYEIVVKSWQMLNCRGVFWMSDAVGYWTSIFYKKGMEDFVNDAALLRWSLKECELQCYWSQWEHREIQWKPTLRSAEAQSRVVETHIVRVSTRHPERAGAKDMYWPRCCLLLCTVYGYVYYATLRQFGVDVFVLCDSTLGSNMKSNGSVDPGRIGNSSIVLCYQKVPYLGIFGLFLLAVYRTFCYMSSFGGRYYVDVSLFCYHNLC